MLWLRHPVSRFRRFVGGDASATIDVAGRPLRRAGIVNRTLAEWMGGKDDSVVTQAVKRLEAKMQGSRKLTKFYRALRREMPNAKI
jgi:hypothetical protein